MMVLLDMDMPENCVECDEIGIRAILECRLIFSGCANCGRHPHCPIKAEIPTGASNGDVLKIMFPRAKTWIENIPEMQLDVMRFDLEDSETLDCFNLEWWNAPWKGDKDA